MKSSTAMLLEIVLVFGTAFGIGIWQYVSTVRDMKKTERERERARESDPTPPTDAAS